MTSKTIAPSLVLRAVDRGTTCAVFAQTHMATYISARICEIVYVCNYSRKSTAATESAKSSAYQLIKISCLPGKSRAISRAAAASTSGIHLPAQLIWVTSIFGIYIRDRMGLGGKLSLLKCKSYDASDRERVIGKLKIHIAKNKTVAGCRKITIK